MTNGLIFHNFVPFNIQQDLATLFLGFFFQFFQKFVVEDIWSTKISSRNLKKSKKIQFFSMKSYFLLLNLNSTCSQLSFEVYNVSVAQNLKFQLFLDENFSWVTFVIQRLIAAKVYNWGGCFWYLWIAKDQNIVLVPNFEPQNAN